MQKLFCALLCLSIALLTGCDNKPEIHQPTTTNDSSPSTTSSAQTVTNSNTPFNVPTTDAESTTIALTPSRNTQQLSQDHAQDIADDLKAMWAATSQAKRNADLTAQKLEAALVNDDYTTLQQVLEETNQAIIKLNRQYDAVTLKSSEVTAARERLKEHNVMQYELGKMITAPVPDQTAFNAHLEKYSQMKKMIDLEMQTLTQKASVSQ